MTQTESVQATSWVVLKFGGTSVSLRHRWNEIGARLRERQGEGLRCVVVVSALSGVTNALQAMASGTVDRRSAWQELRERHAAFAAELDIGACRCLDDVFAEAEALLDRAPGSSTGAEVFAWQAEVLALGELMSSRIGQAYLAAQGAELGWSDAREWLRAVSFPNQSPWARFQSANCAVASDQTWRDRFAGQSRHVITQGFIARDDHGATCVLGRGGSDTSAAYFGALLGARRVEIWTDVPGMFSANPRAVPQARLLGRLDYAEAQEIATTGAKVLHPRCIGPCRDAGVPIWIRDTEHPTLTGTVIAGDATQMPGVKAISSRRGIVLVSMESMGMWQQVGFLADVFEIFKRHGLSIDLIGSAETNVTVSLDPSDNLVSSDVLDQLCTDLSAVCRVKVIAPAAAITLVGRGMRSLLHRLSSVLASFGRERVHLISQSSNDLNLTFVVDEALESGLLPHLHELLVHSGAMPVHDERVFGPSWRRMQGREHEVPEAWWQSARGRLLERARGETPCYVYHLPTLRDRARQLRALDAVDRIHFAIKANPHPDLLRALHAEGLGFECVSVGEVRHVLASVPGVDPSRILFTPSFAPIDEYAASLALGVRTTIDNVELLRGAPEVFRGQALMLRIDPGFGHGHHEKVRTGGREAKFGLALESLPELQSLLAGLGAKIVGVHAHIGSGIDDADQWREVFARLAGVADSLGTVEVIDVGGGLGVAYEPGSDPFDLDGYGRALAEMKEAWPQYDIWIEPGRFLVAECGVLLARVTQVVEKQGVRRVGVDAGMHTLLRPALYGAWHAVEPLSRGDGGAMVACDVVGPICETGDVLARRRQLPVDTAPGDVVAITHAGAYGAVMASRYNLRGLPDEDVVDE